jgi:hypothetical protein
MSVWLINANKPPSANIIPPIAIGVKTILFSIADCLRRNGNFRLGLLMPPTSLGNGILIDFAQHTLHFGKPLFFQFYPFFPMLDYFASFLFYRKNCERKHLTNSSVRRFPDVSFYLMVFHYTPPKYNYITPPTTTEENLSYLKAYALARLTSGLEVIKLGVARIITGRASAEIS